MATIKIKDHLIIPFGCPKWDIKKIKVVGVSTQATYFESDTPCAYIEKNDPRPLRLQQICQLFPQDFPDIDDYNEAMNYIRDLLKTSTEIQTDSERLFLDLYFSYCMKVVTPHPREIEREETARIPIPRNDPAWVFEALVPLPQAHLYLDDPLDDSYSYAPENMVKVDFVFWTGRNIVAVEIDGPSHAGSERHITKDRMLMRAGVTTVHILNSELRQHKEKVITNLLPKPIREFWTNVEHPSWPPLAKLPWEK